jgi:hypothetical protein
MSQYASPPREPQCFERMVAVCHPAQVIHSRTHLVDEQGQRLHAISHHHVNSCSASIDMEALRRSIKQHTNSRCERTSMAAALQRSRVTSSKCCFFTRGMMRCACHFSFSDPLRISTYMHSWWFDKKRV